LVACLRHLVQVVGVPLQQAVAMATAVPASAAGLRDRGTLRPGGRADLLLLNPDLGVRSVYSGGVLVPPA
jgi:N-acetylglucosamine-6-phosphate deacetylase